MDLNSARFVRLAKVKAAMNQINEATRMREANKEKAEGEKILQVKAAEADCDAKKLSGEGVAKQRKVPTALILEHDLFVRVILCPVAPGALRLLLNPRRSLMGSGTQSSISQLGPMRLRVRLQRM
jgi:hypothetical protein